MPAHAEQPKLIGFSLNHREKSSLKVSLGNKKWDFSSFAAVPVKTKKAGQTHQKEQIKHVWSGLC